MKRQKLTTLLCISLVFGVLVALVISGRLHMPTGLRHLLHLAVPPEDLYVPVVAEEFPLWKAGYSKSYILIPKYLDFYEVGLQIANGRMSSKHQFDGKLGIELFSGSEMIAEYEVTDIQGGVYDGTDMNYYKKVRFATFEIPISGKYKDDLAVKLTVLEADQELEEYGDSLQIYIAVRSSP